MPNCDVVLLERWPEYRGNRRKHSQKGWQSDGSRPQPSFDTQGRELADAYDA